MKNHRVISVDDLASGKVSLQGPTEQDDQYCTEHDGEENKFYCRTCKKMVCRDCVIIKQRCRDHNYVTLKEESKERSSQLKEMLNKCTETTRLCQVSMEKVEKAKSELSGSVAKFKADLDNSQKEQVEQVKLEYAQQARRVNKTYQENKDKLEKTAADLNEKVQKLESTYEEGQRLLDTASHAMIVSRYQSMQETFLEAYHLQIDEDVGDLADIPRPVTPMYVGKQRKEGRNNEVTNNNEVKYHGPVGKGTPACCCCFVM